MPRLNIDFLLTSFHSFVNTINNQTDITLVKKFSQWSYVSSSLRERMPYVTLNDPNTLLTTSANPSLSQYGTLVSRNSSHSPALWIEGAAENPQVLWYWMRESKGFLIFCILYVLKMLMLKSLMDPYG